MFSPLGNATYRRLFLAQVVALLGTGMATVALALLAHDLGGASSGEILGVALAIKMVAYITVAPFASALAFNVPRKALLIALDVVRAGVAVALLFVSDVWQVYGLMALLYVASAAFTPAFQSMIPDVLPDDEQYTKALSLSRLAADLESVASPVLAAVLLSVMTYSNLFAGTAIGFGVSAVLVLSALLPTVLSVRPKPFLQRLTVGFRLFALTPRLRGLLAISFATAAGGAMIFVNTVVIVQTRLELGPEATAWALAAFGAGSMFAALFVPRLLDYMSDRWLVIAGGAMMVAGLLAGAFHHHEGYTDLLVLWINIGVGYSFTVTPAGRALRRSAAPGDRRALFAAHFALSHGCWLLAYPVAGLIGATWGIPAAFSVLAALCGLGSLGAWLFWPSEDPEAISHDHSDLPPDHPHLREHGIDHVHPYVIDDLHPRWK